MLKTLQNNTSALSDPAVFPLGPTAAPPVETMAGVEPKENSSDSLFEHFAWLYIFCRERLFRDDTARMIRALWPERRPDPGEKMIELGCGPGFYSCEFSERFPQLRVVGVDRSPSQLKWAREKAGRHGLDNCHFQKENVLDLSFVENSFDVLIASRLFTVLPKRQLAVAEMFRVLRPGGRCFIAEPRYAFWASIPLYAMWLLASITRVNNGYREPDKARVLSPGEMEGLVASQPWKNIRTWNEGRYQYALCEKG